MAKNFEERLQALRESIQKRERLPETRWENIRKKLKKAVLISAAIAALGSIPTFYLTKDFILKRQNYPERNVLYRTSNVIYVSGGESKSEKPVDRESEIKVYEGGQESKVGTYLCRTLREIRDDIEYYNMDDSQKIRVASATRKPERVQAGLRFKGSLTFNEIFAEIILGKESRSPQKYTAYEFVPERGIKEKEVNIVINLDKTRTLETRLSELRSIGLGWMFGKNFRAGTLLEGYAKTESNKKRTEEFLKVMKEIDSTNTQDIKTREKLFRKAMEIEQSLERAPFLTSLEDGIVDILPQESTLYLGSHPPYLERVMHDLGFGRHKRHRLRVENYWDPFPGNIPILNKITLGSGGNSVAPFAKYNNGGYIVYDKFGKLAQIDIKDFLLYYGLDVLYSYFLDLNGDGKLDKSKELIGQVLCRTTHDERINLDEVLREKPQRDVTITMNYSFMAPDNDLVKGKQLFNLCGYLESFIPDQINRGFGKHSFLGHINQQRSDIMLYNDLTVENMNRALTEEQPLVAPYDIVRVLIAAKRPHAKELAEAFGIQKHFEGQYQTSSLLKERTEIGPLPGIGLFLGSALGLGYYLRKRRRSH